MLRLNIIIIVPVTAPKLVFCINYLFLFDYYNCVYRKFLNLNSKVFKVWHIFCLHINYYKFYNLFIIIMHYCNIYFALTALKITFENLPIIKIKAVEKKSRPPWKKTRSYKKWSAMLKCRRSNEEPGDHWPVTCRYF